jgi:GWxTD domain-containing protein
MASPGRQPGPAPWFRTAALGLALALAGTGCSWFTVDDRELDRELAAASAAIDSGAAAATLHDLDKLTWHRKDSIAARRLLVAACLETDTIESRRIAERALRELVALDPENPDYRFDLAEVLLDRGFEREARQELDALLDDNPDHPGGHLAFGRYHLALYRRFCLPGDYDAALGHFARAANALPEDHDAALLLAEAYTLGKQWEAALAVLERMREQWPADGWIAALEGTCLARPGTYPEAAAAFERAFSLLSDAERRPFMDLSLIANPYEQERYATLVPDEREDFLRMFWRAKDPLPVTRVNERHVEHYRRVVAADLRYAVPRFEKRGYDTARGEMLIRYGEPLYIEYIQGSRALFFSFPGWYHVYAAAGGQLEATFYDMALNGMFYYPFTGLPTGADLAAYKAPQSYAHDYGGRWITPALAVGEFKVDVARTRAEVYLALDADSLARYQGTTLAAGTVVFDDRWNEVARREEEVDLDQAHLAGAAGRALVHQVDFDLAPGSYIIASQIEGDAGAVVGTATRPVEIRRFGAVGLALSTPELAFAISRTGPAPFTKGRLNVVPNATGEVRGEERLVLYFEIYHLVPAPAAGAAPGGQSRYEVHYRITPADREGNSILTRIGNALRAKTFIESSFFEEGAVPTVRRNLAIDVSALPPDRYRLELEVTDLVGGGTARRELTFRRAE